MSTNRHLLILIIMVMNASCKVEPHDINYGTDHCHNCDMTVVDKAHAAQYVTKKGRTYMFDAVECMVWDVNKNKNEDEMAYLLVADFGNPGALFDAKKAIFIISKNLKSPMGANLSAFSSNEKAHAAQREFGGELYNWEQLKNQLKK